MRRLSRCLLSLSAALLAGCATHHPQDRTIGLISPAQRQADLRDDRNRLLGVDRAPRVPLNEPIYLIPASAFGAAIDVVFVEPTDQLYKYFTHDNAATAARDMLDENSADKRRFGVLRLADEAYARQGTAERNLWADMARQDKDYTVRAAAIRALNWSRDNTRGELYIDALKDEQPLVRLEAAKALANNPDFRAAGPLADHLQQDVSHDVRIAVADALRCYKTDEVAHALIAVLDDSDFDVAWQARQSLRLMTAHDFQYDIQAWLNYLSESRAPFG